MATGDCPCFNLGLAHRKVLRAFEDALDPLGLTVPQAHAVSVLYRNDGLLAKELARELQVDAGTLSPMADRLEKQGLLTRCPHPVDRRATRLCLTERAHRLRPSIEAALCEAQARLAAKFTPEELETLMALCKRLVEEEAK
jgi:DNA-binding MarR family transcriptional regulator